MRRTNKNDPYHLKYLEKVMKKKDIPLKPLEDFLDENYYPKKQIRSLTATKNEFHTIQDGKCCTIRKGHREITLGLLEFKMLNDEENLTVNVTQVIHCKVIDLPMEYVKRDDFQDKHDLVNQLKQYYPDIYELTEITAVVFEKLILL